jgi:hypothetical protein
MMFGVMTQSYNPEAYVQTELKLEECHSGRRRRIVW